jgi:hypothetical protein
MLEELDLSEMLVVLVDAVVRMREDDPMSIRILI